MKKLVLTLIVAFSFCGSILAQEYGQSHWPDFNHHNFQFQGGLVAAISINGHVYTVEDEGWDYLEAAAFVGDQCRGNNLFLTDAYVIEYGDPYPVFDALPIFYDNGGEVVSFKLYDHTTGIEYDNCEITYLGEPMTILTGEEHYEGWLDEPYLPIILNFTSGEAQTFTKQITGYGESTDNSGYYFIASPVDGVAPTNVEGMTYPQGDDYAKFDLYSFDQEQDSAEWRNYKAENFNLVAGMGYLYANKNDVTLTVTGTPTTAPVNVTLNKTEGTGWSGWNLVGNPFGGEAYIDRACYTLNGGGYVTLNVGTPIEVMQGVLVEASEDGETLTFSTEAPEAKSANLSLNVTRENKLVDRAIVNFDNGRNLNKITFRENDSKLYMTQDGEDYAVVSAPSMGEMPVSFKAENNGSYTLSFSSQEVTFNYLHLIDNMTGADVDLLVNPSYSFDALTTDYASRFKLVFATGNNSDDSFAFFSNGSFIINNDGEATLQVVDVMGRILSSENINGSASINVNGAAGVYMLRLINGNDVKVQKVIVK